MFGYEQQIKIVNFIKVAIKKYNVLSFSICINVFWRKNNFLKDFYTNFLFSRTIVHQHICIFESIKQLLVAGKHHWRNYLILDSYSSYIESFHILKFVNKNNTVIIPSSKCTTHYKYKLHWWKLKYGIFLHIIRIYNI